MLEIDDKQIIATLTQLVEGEKKIWMHQIRALLNSEVISDLDLNNIQQSKEKGISELLDNFDLLRQQNIFELRNISISEKDLEISTVHPKLGEVSVQNVIATWVSYDLSQISHLVKIMCKPFEIQTGPWKEMY